MNTCGLVSVSFRENTPEEILEHMKKAGLKYVEWGSDVHVPAGDEQRAQQVRYLTDSAGVSVSSYGTYYKLGQNQNIEPYIKCARILGADIMRIWAGTESSAETDVKTRAALVSEAKRVCGKAAEHNLKIDFEYHPNTLTDNADSARRLITEINEPNCGLYWQPNYKLTREENLDAISKVKGYVDVLHLFYWDKNACRFPLSTGKDELCAYLTAFSDKPTIKLLEFVPNDDITCLADEAEMLFTVLKSVEE